MWAAIKGKENTVDLHVLLGHFSQRTVGQRSKARVCLFVSRRRFRSSLAYPPPLTSLPPPPPTQPPFTTSCFQAISGNDRLKMFLSLILHVLTILSDPMSSTSSWCISVRHMWECASISSSLAKRLSSLLQMTAIVYLKGLAAVCGYTCDWIYEECRETFFCKCVQCHARNSD